MFISPDSRYFFRDVFRDIDVFWSSPEGGSDSVFVNLKAESSQNGFCLFSEVVISRHVDSWEKE
jgi:hypothetical protein